MKNPQLNLEALSLIEKKVQERIASPEDLETLDYFLSSLGSRNYILNQFKEYNINSYQEYIVEQRIPAERRNRAVDGILLGTIKGAISVLRDSLTGKF